MKPKDIIKAFKQVGLSPQYKVGEYLNIARPDGIHCEFYPCGDKDLVFTATYTIDKKECELDFWLPEDLDVFVETVCKILEFKIKKRGVK